jgi:hypothetical protein
MRVVGHYLYDLAVDAAGNAYLAGYLGSSTMLDLGLPESATGPYSYVASLDAEGTGRWLRTHPSVEAVTRIAASHDSLVVVREITPPASPRESRLLQLRAADGSEMAEIVLGESSQLWIGALAFDEARGAAMGGTFTDPVDVRPRPMVQRSELGAGLLWRRVFDVRGIAVLSLTPSGAIYFGGTQQGTSDFGGGVGGQGTNFAVGLLP